MGEMSVEAVVERLENAERQLRWAKVAGVAVLLLAGAGVLMGQVRLNGRTVEAEKFVLWGAGGEERAVLSEKDGGVALALLDRGGRTRIRLYVNEQDTAGLEVSDAEGRTGAYLLTFKDGPTKILFVHPNGGSASLRLGPNGSPSLSLHDAEGNYRAGLMLERDGRPTLYLSDQKKLRAVLSVSKEGVARLTLGDKTGRYGAVLSVRANGTPSLTLYDTENKVAFQAP